MWKDVLLQYKYKKKYPYNNRFKISKSTATGGRTGEKEKKVLGRPGKDNKTTVHTKDIGTTGKEICQWSPNLSDICNGFSLKRYNPYV